VTQERQVLLFSVPYWQ